jgi:cytochrome b subunit of formate dehydrogenase
MNKIKTKYAVDLITLISFVITAITGLAIKFFMPSGVRQAGQQIFLGITRHSWVEIHNWAGIIMIIFALIHVTLYWNIFACMTRNFFKKNEECGINTKTEK